jgi:acetoin utilization protein AcuB
VRRRSVDAGEKPKARSVQLVSGMLMPTIDRYMTREPYSVMSTETLAHAKERMQAHEIRHLPVIDGGRLVGMITERDLRVIDAMPGLELAHIEIARVMSAPIQVWGTAPLDEVAELMTKRRADCVVVRGGHGVEGIFTAVDALVALTDLLRRATT